MIVRLAPSPSQLARWDLGSSVLPRSPLAGFPDSGPDEWTLN